MWEVKFSSLQFFVIQFVVLLFWGIPESIQKIPKILFLCFLVYVYLLFLKKAYISNRQLIKNFLIVIGCVAISYNGAYQSSLVNVLFSSFAVALLPHICRIYTPREMKIAKSICYLVCCLMFIQLLFFRTLDGRPTLGYEINWSAAYLFIFFIYSDVLKFRFGQVFVIVVSFLLLSRLLIFSLLFLFVIKFLKNRNVLPKIKFNWLIILILSYTSFFIFNVWFLTNIEIDSSYDTSINRVSSVNDGSNKLRFTVNMLILEGFLEGDAQLKYGYGQIAKGASRTYEAKYNLMPHNELLDSIAEFGWVVTILFICFSYSFVNRVFCYENYEYIFPTLLFTLILWARFLIVPSLEMFFLLFLFGYNLRKNEIVIANS